MIGQGNMSDTSNICLNSAIQGIAPSATYAMIALAQDLKSRGRDIISLGAGEPDFPTPEHVCDAAVDAIRLGKTKYTPVAGLAELRKAVADKFQRDNGLTYDVAQTIVSNGGKQVIAAALAVTLEAGDEVVIPVPYWVSYPDMVRLNGGTPVIVDTGKSAKLTPQTLRAALNGNTRWIILNSPNNPSGLVYSREELDGLASLLLDFPKVLVMSDEIYEHLVYGVEFCSIAQCDQMQARSLIVNGVSKGHAMTGWRIGYGAGPGPLIAAMEKWQGQISSGPCSISQYAAIAALNGSRTHIETCGKAFEARRNLVLGKLEQCAGIDIIVPQGAFYIFARIDAVIGKTTADGRTIASDIEFALALLESKGICVVPGSAFGMGNGLRLSFAASDDELKQACARIIDFWNELG